MNFHTSLSLPAQAPHIPKPHQLEAEAFLRDNKRAILADDMGAGKTDPAIRASVGRTIVFCPAPLKQNWRKEILRERPGARILTLSGRVPSPIEADVDFVIINYDIVDAWRQALIAWRPVTASLTRRMYAATGAPPGFKQR